MAFLLSVALMGQFPAFPGPCPGGVCPVAPAFAPELIIEPLPHWETEKERLEWVKRQRIQAAYIKSQIRKYKIANTNYIGLYYPAYNQQQQIYNQLQFQYNMQSNISNQLQYMYGNR